MTALGEEIRRLIRRHGPISVAEYMALCLSHPVHGYYMAREPFGRAGDFITAPEISQMFGELLGLWAAETWLRLGRPEPFRFVEIGPGRGLLMADALRAVRAVPGFLEAMRLHLVETSPRLRSVQAEALASARPVWHERIEEVPEGAAIILANEVFDALPVRQFAKTKTDWRERVVGLAEDRLVFGLASDPVLPPLLPSAAEAAAPGVIVEVSPAAQALARSLAERLGAQGGAALIIDYGRTRSAPGATFQAVRGHASTDPLADPGLADLTAHVDFEALAQAAAAGGAQVSAVLSQGEFLRRLGIDLRADRLKRSADRAKAAVIESARVRLTDPAQMGTLFKALALTSPGLHAPAFDQPPETPDDQDSDHD